MTILRSLSPARTSGSHPGSSEKSGNLLQSGRPDYLALRSVVSARSLRSLSPARTSGPHPGSSEKSGNLLQSGRPDSNRGPLRPERSALPD
jgi:hypothetical protein